MYHSYLDSLSLTHDSNLVHSQGLKNALVHLSVTSENTLLDEPQLPPSLLPYPLPVSLNDPAVLPSPFPLQKESSPLLAKREFEWHIVI